ncbi:hypothetical protein V2I01_02080 [Micromonospora sp. BRA006-A]|nr:hypothetical protein [Micromonospora sp. BRA006-A]
MVIFTLLQAGTLAPAARRLGVTAPAEASEILLETAPLERMRADLLQLEVPAGSRLAGVHVDELRLPVGAAVTLVLRDGSASCRALTPGSRSGTARSSSPPPEYGTRPSGGCGR